MARWGQPLVNSEIFDPTLLRPVVESSIRSSRVLARYLVYFERLERQGLPIILSFAHLAEGLDLLPTDLAAMAIAPDKFYREYSIPKKSGGLRHISAPLPSLLTVQQDLVRLLLRKIIPHEAATAFFPGTNIRTHVSRHREGAWLYKLDIEDFFPSISSIKVRDLFISLGYLSSIAAALARLMTLNNSLPQGAPTSPYVANLIAGGLDKKIEDYCRGRGLIYSRYADDLVLSGDKLERVDIDFIHRAVEAEGFAVNEKKTRLYKPGMNGRLVTGLTISEGVIRPPKQWRRKLGQEVFFFLKFFKQDLEKTESQIAALIERRRDSTVFDPLYVDRLLGRLNFWLWVEPGSRKAADMKDAILKAVSGKES